MSRSVDRLNQKIFFLPTFISLIRSKIRRQVVVDCWMDSVVLVFVLLQWKKNPTLFCCSGVCFVVREYVASALGAKLFSLRSHIS